MAKSESPRLSGPVHDFRRLCRDAGLRVTQQRLEVFREVAGATDHPSAEALHRRLKKRIPTLALDTVYRTLRILERHGVLRKIHGPDGRARFDGNPQRHHHLVCRKCNKILDFEWQELDAIEPPIGVCAWGEISSVQVDVRGLCPQCVRRQRRRARRG